MAENPEHLAKFLLESSEAQTLFAQWCDMSRRIKVKSKVAKKLGWEDEQMKKIGKDFEGPLQAAIMQVGTAAVLSAAVRPHPGEGDTQCRHQKGDSGPRWARASSACPHFGDGRQGHVIAPHHGQCSVSAQCTAIDS